MNGDRQSLSHFCLASHDRQSVNRGSPNMTKNFLIAGFDLIK
jgi:hypothetical protein